MQTEDAADTKQVENAMDFFQQRELLFSAMLKSSAAEMVSLIGLSGNIIYETPLIQKIYTGKRLSPDLIAHYQTSGKAQTASAFGEAIRNPGMPVIYRTDILRDDETLMYVESSFTNLLHIKAINAILIIDRDITQSAVAEKKLIESEKLFRLLVESVKEYAIYMIDPAGHVLSWNLGAELITGYSAKEIIGKHFSVFYADEDIRQSLPEKHLEITNRNGRYENIGSRVRKDGSLFWADEIFSASYGEKGNLRGYVKVIRDITERKKLEREVELLNEKLTKGRELKERELRTEELKLANKELEAFSYSVSHDLRAPLRAISGFSAILKEDYSKVLDEEGNRIIDKVISNSNRMGELIDDLLSFSRMGKLDTQSDLLNMQSLVESSVEELLPQKTASKYQLLIHAIPNCQGDRSMMKQVWQNLIENAVKYASKKAAPVIEIGYSEDEQTYTYFVRDNGVGFDMQYAGKLFGVFQRLHHHNQFEGTGLGLALVQRIIQKHNGTIWAEASPDNGAVFYFKIPKKITAE